MKFSPRRSPVAKAVRVLEFYVPSFGAAMLSGAPSADDACCSATPLHGSGLSSGAPVAAATSAGVMRAHFGARYTWPRRCCAGCRTAAADHLLLETMGCAAVGRSFVMSSNSTEAWDAQEWVVTELQHHPCRLFHPYPLVVCTLQTWDWTKLAASEPKQSVSKMFSLPKVTRCSPLRVPLTRLRTQAPLNQNKLQTPSGPERTDRCARVLAVV